MNVSRNPLAPEHLPSFLTAPGDTDILLVVVGIFLLLFLLALGLIFLRIHTLPERIAHKSHKLQFEIVAILGLIALFTHMHIFWIAGLLLAFIDIPDFGNPLRRIAGAVETMAGLKFGEGASERGDEIRGGALTGAAGENAGPPPDGDAAEETGHA